MRKSLKFKITVWFSIVFLLISVVVLIALQTVSKNILIRDQKANIQTAVTEFSKKISLKDGQLTVSPGAHFYERGVYRVLFDSNGSIIQGELPNELKNIPIEFLEETVRETETQKNFYLEYDVAIHLGDDSYWVKGIALLNDEMYIVESTIRGGVILVCVLGIVAIAGVYFVVCRALAPVEKIRKMAIDIAESSDLSRRIQIGNEKDEIHALANTFDEMLDKIEQTLMREKQFSSDVSHELRTPIAVILSECEYAKSCVKTAEEYADSVEVVNRQAERMQKLVSELLTISRMENNTIQTDFEEIDISELLSFVCDEQEEIQNPNIHMQRQITPDIIARADRDLLARLFINLITNAHQYSKEMGMIEISLSKVNENVVFTIKDNGIGIAESDVPLIWERFYRGDKSRTVNENKSMGLGLSMVKWIAECHNGSLSVNSKLGEGSEFVFSFPAK